ncbi:UDP-glycosyltransferase UGT5-like [Aethina tumida]|uniref:UDP-glycosyltransferase UGT5-like n=1 Tax=Aethina tumida TaxID=116153 RepID=UPI002147638C|nr:UDP-glycosyltransferase UGT5-like [Aethina tumida]
MLRLLLVITTISQVFSARILGLFPCPSISHQVTFQPIWKELSLRGHSVTIISPNVIKERGLTNLTELDMGFTYDILSKPENNFGKIMRKDNHPIYNIHYALYTVELAITMMLESPDVQNLLKDDSEQFDLIMYEAVHPLAAIFSAKYRVPTIGIQSMPGFTATHDMVGNPTNPVTTTDPMLPFGVNKSFPERIKSVLYQMILRFYWNWYLLPRVDTIARKYLNNNIPYMGDVEKNVSLLLLNTNVVMNYPRPNVPNVVEIGQMHIKKKKPLPKNLKAFLDKSKTGVVYFSLGSNVKSANESKDFVYKVKAALGSLPYDVVWKWETDTMENKPDNILLQKWLPQQDLLGHPNIRVFVTQGGLQSIEESISNGVPMVILPIIADQPFNAKRMENLRIAKVLEIETMTRDQLHEAIVEVAQTKEYKDNVLKYQKLILDQPNTGIEKAIWWIEYVLRHNGATHLRYSAVDTPFYKYYLLDVISFFIVMVISFLFVLVKLYKIIIYFSNDIKKSKKID